jgi:hypothetical protein
MKLSVRGWLLAAPWAALVGAAAAPALAEDGQAGLTASARHYQRVLREAAKEFGVPVALLQAIAYAETRWHPHVAKGRLRRNGEPAVEVEAHNGMPLSYGIMGLRDDRHFGHSLVQGAALVRVAPALAASDTRSNIRAAAALLASYGAPKDARSPLEDWEPALARYSGIPQRAVAQIYSFEVLSAIREGRRGTRFEIDRGQVDLEKVYGKDRLRQLSAPRITLGARRASAAPDYPPAHWNPAAGCNYSGRSAAASHLTLHTTQGSYAGAISWFQHCGAGVSAHYVIRSSDGQVTQMVREADKAWHAGNANGYTIGIEHEGYIANPAAWYSSAMYASSAALVRHILATRSLAPDVYDGSGGWNAVPPDALYNVKGHVNYAGQTHTDPGPGWDWPRYKALVTSRSNIGVRSDIWTRALP